MTIAEKYECPHCQGDGCCRCNDTGVSPKKTHDSIRELMLENIKLKELVDAQADIINVLSGEKPDDYEPRKL